MAEKWSYLIRVYIGEVYKEIVNVYKRVYIL